MDSKPIAIVVPHNAQSLDICGPLDAFLEANRQAPGRCNYDVRLLSVGPNRTSLSEIVGGMTILGGW